MGRTFQLLGLQGLALGFYEKVGGTLGIRWGAVGEGDGGGAREDGERIVRLGGGV